MAQCTVADINVCYTHSLSKPLLLLKTILIARVHFSQWLKHRSRRSETDRLPRWFKVGSSQGAMNDGTSMARLWLHMAKSCRHEQSIDMAGPACCLRRRIQKWNNVSGRNRGNGRNSKQLSVRLLGITCNHWDQSTVLDGSPCKYIYIWIYIYIILYYIYIAWKHIDSWERTPLQISLNTFNGFWAIMLSHVRVHKEVFILHLLIRSQQ